MSVRRDMYRVFVEPVHVCPGFVAWTAVRPLECWSEDPWAAAAEAARLTLEHLASLRAELRESGELSTRRVLPGDPRRDTPAGSATS